MKCQNSPRKIVNQDVPRLISSLTGRKGCRCVLKHAFSIPRRG